MPTETINISSQVRVQITRADMLTLIGSNLVSPKKIYTISDGGPSDVEIDVFGIAVNNISTIGFNQGTQEFGYYDINAETWTPIADGIVADGNYNEIDVSGGGLSWIIANNVVTFAKMQQIGAQTVLGRETGTGNVEQIGLASTLGITSGFLFVQPSTVRQLTKVVLNSVDVGTRSQMHYSDSGDTGIEWGITDDGTEIDITTIRGSWYAVGMVAFDLVAASTTTYWGLSGGITTDSTIETNRSVAWPIKSDWKNLYVTTFTTQSATGSIRFTLRIGAADSAINVLVAAGSAAGVFSDTSNTASNNQGDRVAMKGQNSATGNSASAGWTIANRPSA